MTTFLEKRLAKRGLNLGPTKIREQAAAAIVTAMIAEKIKLLKDSPRRCQDIAICSRSCGLVIESLKI